MLQRTWGPSHDQAGLSFDDDDDGLLEHNVAPSVAMQNDIHQQDPMLVALLLRCFVALLLLSWESGIISTPGSVTDHVISVVGWRRVACHGQ